MMKKTLLICCVALLVSSGQVLAMSKKPKPEDVEKGTCTCPASSNKWICNDTSNPNHGKKCRTAGPAGNIDEPLQTETIDGR